MHFPILIQDLAIILAVAAFVTFIFRRIQQPLVLGYIVAGIIVGPYTPAILSIEDTESVKVWAELGVIFLMFTLGLEFSFRRLARVGMSAVVTALIQIGAMLAWGYVAAYLLGWSSMDALFLGCMIAISSTTIIIKALEELGLKSKKFAELVFGILIVEDLAAILMLVALTNIVTTSAVGGINLLFAGGQLLIVVGSWFVVGMFVIPRFIRSVSLHGNDEMLTVVATGLCLALVALAAYFGYSVALGAFIMGSILAESSEAKRIEHLVLPLKDIFGAIFFVSVGMLLDPKTIIENVGAIALISAVIIFGKLASVSFGALISGQSIKSSLQTGFSMAQIGEFSFIIASLGLTYGVISTSLYPIIVASSLVTTFTTPYLIKTSVPLAGYLEASLPLGIKAKLESYAAWVQRRSIRSEKRELFSQNLNKWALNAIIVVMLFSLSAKKLVPTLDSTLNNPSLVRGLGWLISFILASPSLWAMLSAFRSRSSRTTQKQWVSFPAGGAQLLGRIATISLLGTLSIAFFPAFATLVVTLVSCGALLLTFRRQVEGYYRWFEMQFQSGFQADLPVDSEHSLHLNRLAPWDAHLVELKVPARSFLAGQKLIDLKLRESYSLNIVVIVRDGESIVAPQATETIYPGDTLLCFATDEEIERFKSALESTQEQKQSSPQGLEAFDMRRLRVNETSQIKGISIRLSGIREVYDCIVVGLERRGERIRSPSSDVPLKIGDVLWVVGEREKLQRLTTSSFD